MIAERRNGCDLPRRQRKLFMAVMPSAIVLSLVALWLLVRSGVLESPLSGALVCLLLLISGPLFACVIVESIGRRLRAKLLSGRPRMSMDQFMQILGSESCDERVATQMRSFYGKELGIPQEVLYPTDTAADLQYPVGASEEPIVEPFQVYRLVESCGTVLSMVQATTICAELLRGDTVGAQIKRLTHELALLNSQKGIRNGVGSQ